MVRAFGCRGAGDALADYFWPGTQQASSVEAGFAFFNQQCGLDPLTKVHAWQLELAWQAPWQFSGALFAGRAKLLKSEPRRFFPYSMDWDHAGELRSARDVRWFGASPRPAIKLRLCTL